MAVLLRNFSSTAVATTLAGPLLSAATTWTVVTSSGYPAAPFVVRLDADTAAEELCLVGTVVGNVWSSITRGFDGTTAQSHASGATVEHAAIGADFRDAISHAVSATAQVHSLTAGSSVVGTLDTQTLSGKTLSSPILTTPSITGSGGALTLPAGPDTLTGTTSTQTLTNKTLTAPTIVTPTSTNGTWTGGTVNPNSLQVASVAVPTISSFDTLTNKSVDLASNTLTGTKAQFNAALTGDDFVTLTGTETLTSKTLTAPVIASIVNTGTLTLPTSSDTLVGRATTDTLTNKTLNGVVGALTGDAASGLGVWTTATIAATGTGWTGYTWTYRYNVIGKTAFISARLPLTGAGGSAGLGFTMPWSTVAWSAQHRYFGTGGVLAGSNIWSLVPYAASGSSTVSLAIAGLLVNGSSNPNSQSTVTAKVLVDNVQTFTATAFTNETGVTLASGDVVYLNMTVEIA